MKYIFIKLFFDSNCSWNYKLEDTKWETAWLYSTQCSWNIDWKGLNINEISAEVKFTVGWQI